jgi:NADPH:quinone reductase-like Zn-dependent oxidoreductase
MGGTYKATVLVGAGGPEKLVQREFPIPEPGKGEALVRVLACGLGSTEVGTMRRGSYPFAPKVPFIPGYDVVGIVEALGEDASGVAIGQRVACLSVFGGFGEVVVRGVRELVPVPDGLDSAEVVALVLNYVSAWQMIERVAKPLAGDLALVTGANGGVGSALLELLGLRGVKVIGAASAAHRALVESYGARWIESRGIPLREALRPIAPEGVDVSFDAIGGLASAECLDATRRGGRLVGYGWMGTAKDGRISTALTLKTLMTVLVRAPFSGRRGTFYGITGLYRADVKPFREDLGKLLGLLALGKIRPRIAARLPLFDARIGIEMLEKGGIEGKIVLMA